MPAGTWDGRHELFSPPMVHHQFATSRDAATKNSPAFPQGSTPVARCRPGTSPGTLPRSKNAPQGRFCRPGRGTAGTSCSRPRWCTISSQRPGTPQQKTALRSRKALPPSRAAGRELPRGLSRALKTPRRGVFAGRDVGRPARAVLAPDGAPSVRNVPGRRNKKQPCVPARLFLFGAPSGTRTQDPLIKSQLLSQTTRTKAINCTFNLTITQGSYGSQQVSMVTGNTQPSTVGKDQVSIVHDLSTPAWSSKSRFVLRA